jgi:hypothetical protein
MDMSKSSHPITTLLCLATFLASLDASAASDGNGNRRQGQSDIIEAPVSGSVSVGGSVGGVAIGVTISAGEARQIAVNNRLTGYGALPPGIAKNLARGKPLPPGIAKKMVPGPMLGQLPHYDGYEWRVAGTDLILVAIGTLVVAEILNDVFL